MLGRRLVGLYLPMRASVPTACLAVPKEDTVEDVKVCWGVLGGCWQKEQWQC